ncbi:MAG: hypothetical protein ACM3SP_18050 [Chloroflexota bacterium]
MSWIAPVDAKCFSEKQNAGEGYGVGYAEEHGNQAPKNKLPDGISQQVKNRFLFG